MEWFGTKRFRTARSIEFFGNCFARLLLAHDGHFGKSFLVVIWLTPDYTACVRVRVAAGWLLGGDTPRARTHSVKRKRHAYQSASVARAAPSNPSGPIAQCGTNDVPSRPSWHSHLITHCWSLRQFFSTLPQSKLVMHKSSFKYFQPYYIFNFLRSQCNSYVKSAFL